MRGIDGAGAHTVGERLRERVEAMRVEHEGRVLTVTVSVGCSSFAELEEKTPEALVSTADKRLVRRQARGPKSRRVARLNAVRVCYFLLEALPLCAAHAVRRRTPRGLIGSRSHARSRPARIGHDRRANGELERLIPNGNPARPKQLWWAFAALVPVFLLMASDGHFGLSVPLCVAGC